MIRIAVLLACFNRKALTLNCLKNLYKAYAPYTEVIQLSVYITDDGSTDGTKDAISDIYPEIHILDGTGSLYWAGGMRYSWSEALKHDYDAYLLLNDDTIVSCNIFEELKNCHEYSLTKYNCKGIYIGSTHDADNKFSYGGAVTKSNLFNTYRFLIPNGDIKICDLGNANIMLVTREVVNKIGILSEAYRHFLADYDYTLTARRNNIPVLITANYCGTCTRDKPDPYFSFIKLSYIERKKFLFHPTGLAFPDQVKYMKKFYPFRLPFIYAAAWFKLIFPNAYVTINKRRRKKEQMNG